MIRVPTEDGWILMNHKDHASLAGAFAEKWGNETFTPPEPLDDIIVGVSRHDDAWVERDAAPVITSEGLPSAFSAELVGSYAAFEEIDLEEYLGVRGNATEACAKDNAYAAIIISMHTVNLLTEQADLDTLSEEQRVLHGDFISGQKERQCQLASEASASQGLTDFIDPDTLLGAFKFLQACDSLSLTVCVDFPKPIFLRHEHPTKDGELVKIECKPLGDKVFKLSPYPFSEQSLEFEVPAIRIVGKEFESSEAFRKAVEDGEACNFTIKLIS